MKDKTIIRERLAYWQGVYASLQKAYIALIEGGVKQYSIDDRQLTRHDLPEIKTAMDDAETKIDELESILNGGAARKAVGVIMRDT